VEQRETTEEPLVVRAADHPSDQAAELNELVHALLHALRRDAAERFGSVATTPGQQRLLRVLQRAGGPRRLGELAQMLDVAPRSITAKVDQAEAEGQVRRVPDPDDRRATLVELTPAGREVLARVSAERSLGAAERLARLTPDERVELIRLLRVVAAAPQAG
jgi:DNA-binding MarR family transcriptional regulator